MIRRSAGVAPHRVPCEREYLFGGDCRLTASPVDSGPHSPASGCKSNISTRVVSGNYPRPKVAGRVEAAAFPRMQCPLCRAQSKGRFSTEAV